MVSSALQLREIFPVCHRAVGPQKWLTLIDLLPQDFDPAAFPEILADQAERLALPPWLPDLARIETAIQAASHREELDASPIELRHNPGLSIIECAWSGLPDLFDLDGAGNTPPRPGKDVVLVWLKPKSDHPVARSASNEELLALKIVVEGLDKREVAQAGDAPLAVLDLAIDRAVARGLLLAPPSALRRDRSIFSADRQIPEEFLVAKTFTLQWHITQSCDLHCKHCYDRSKRATLPRDEAVAVLDQFYDFCQTRHAHGQVSFTGGNPLLHPQFLEIYRAAVDRGLLTAILGNPATPAIIAEICAIRKPEFFQVSLEGLEDHNDFIRGPGHFRRVLDFLGDLRQADIFSMVMLTLTRDNLDQVLPLAQLLRDRADLFTFNRLSLVGEGALLAPPGRAEFESFLKDYLAAKTDNPVLALKDNLFNIIRHRQGQDLFGGCAGFGCGAAFNFVALLPDGEVHACRKFPSPIGNLRSQGLGEIYDSAAARRYRQGPDACRGCAIRHVCGGCLAVISSQGLDIGKDRDPCCFMEPRDHRQGNGDTG